ncbi:MAG: AMP-binding protein [Methylococcaceae bacterium]|nr:AMP-binding protein [Methylococcaceae bacterium]
MTTTLPSFICLPDTVAENLLTDFYITQQGAHSRADLFAHAQAFSIQLPEKAYAVNLCQNRYLFIVAYLAVMLRNQITLLPPNQSPRTLSDLLSAYTPAYCITDSIEAAPKQDTVLISEELLTLNTVIFPPIDQNRILSISFTSGSTGKPKAIAKNWREFQACAQLAIHHFNLANKAMTIVSTVPPQHMYGLETSLFWPLFSRLSVHNSRPFFPEDIRYTLQTNIGTNRLLISTPTHLKACSNSQITWPAVEKVLSSTAPMAIELARHLEDCFNAPLFELLGSTETLSYASRQPVRSEQWQPYQGITLNEQHGVFSLHSGHLQQPVILDDTFSVAENGAFTLQGRSTDLIKIAGKRASLVELNALLNAISGVEEGLFFSDNHERLSIVVVSALSNKTIMNELRPAIDPVFLPRRIIRTPSLPRNATGKLIKTELDALTRGLALV